MKTKITNKFLLPCLLLLTFGAVAQHDNHWYFGSEAGLDFSSGSPVAVTNGQLNSTEAGGTMSDAGGNLLFYTNGLTVWNKEHAIMDNGEGLLGDTSASQSGLIIKKPGSDTQYYIFTTAQFTEADGVRYTEIDMAAQDGLGAVGIKNVPMLTPACEKITAVNHANGTDIWILAHHWGSNGFYAWLVTSGGISAAPVISNTGEVVQGDFVRSAGCMRFSPDGTRLAVANNEVGVELFDFDAASGAVSNPLLLVDNQTCYGIEFSPSGNALYLSQWAKVSQFNLDAADVAASKVTLLEMPDGGGGTLQLGPDSKLYMSHWDKQGLTVINSPDVIGTGCGLDALSIDLAGRNSWWGLPVFLASPFYVTDILSNAVMGCTQAAVSFSASTTIAPESIHWDFGDGETSDEINPVHVYAPGNYTVKVRAVSGYFARYYTKNITVVTLPLPTAFTPQVLAVCDDESGDGIAVFDLSLLNAEILGPQPAANFTVSYHGTLADAEAGAAPIPAAHTNITNPETLFARVTDNATGCHAVTPFAIFVMPVPEIIMDDALDMCENGSVTLTAPEGFSGYLWSTGAVTRSIEVTEAGEYTLTAFLDTGDALCEASKTITVNQIPLPALDLDEEYTLCIAGSIIVMAPEGYDSYLWSTGAVTNYLEITEKGTYTLTVTDNGCENTAEFTAKEILCGFYVPNGISPNDDGKNDKLDLAGLNISSLSIFNRYGEQVYSRANYTNEWHGQADAGTHFLQALISSRHRHQTGAARPDGYTLTVNNK